MTAPIWQTADFSPAPCLPCCGAPVFDCSCALLIPPFGSPYMDYATAVAAIAAQVVDCLLYDEGPADVHTIAVTSTVDVYLKSFAGNALAGDVSINLKAGEVLTLNATASTDGADDPDGRPAVIAGTLTACDQSSSQSDNIVASVTNFVTGTLTFTAPADGEYVFQMLGRVSGIGETYTESTFTLSFDDAWSINPVIAQWDDSGTTRSLWACPKLLLPPLTESTGDWYASCADALAIIADQVSNCVGYVDTDSGSITSFTAVDGGTSLTLAVVLLAPSTSSPPSYGSVNAEAGETISVAWTATAATTGRILAFIYDDTGTLVDQTGGPIATNPWVSIALPYTGRYTVRVQTIDLVGTQTAYSIAVTSSGTLSVNPIQARYDLGLTCSGTLDCGDSCP